MSCDGRDRKIAVCEVLGLRFLHDRAGTFASLLYKDEMVSVRLSVRPSVMQLTQSSQHAQL